MIFLIVVFGRSEFGLDVIDAELCEPLVSAVVVREVPVTYECV